VPDPGEISSRDAGFRYQCGSCPSAIRGGYPSQLVRLSSAKRLENVTDAPCTSHRVKSRDRDAAKADPIQPWRLVPKSSLIMLRHVC
jgi:hypothetical protein